MSIQRVPFLDFGVYVNMAVSVSQQGGGFPGKYTCEGLCRIRERECEGVSVKGMDGSMIVGQCTIDLPM